MLLYQLVTILFIFVSTILHFTIVSAEDCPKISHPGEEVGRISDPRIKEGSGLVASHTYPDIFWTLNDHNGLNHVFAVSTKLNGTVVTDLKLAGSENVDWEAIATAPCSKENPLEMCLYIGDIGDYFSDYQRDYITIYKVKEPELNDLHQETGNWEAFHFQYPNEKFNAESMLIDTITREIVIITKSEKHPDTNIFAKVFKSPLDQVPEAINQLEDTGIELDLIEATDASSSADGQVVIIRMYIGGFLWPRRRQQPKSIVEILNDVECFVSVGMLTRGESIALNSEGTSYFAHSEGTNQPILKFDIFDE